MKKKSWPFFLPRTKRGIFWYVIFTLIFLLYHDFWAWGKFKPLIGGWLPAWFLYLMILIIIYSIAVFFFTKKYWPNPPSNLSKSSEKKKPFDKG